MGITEDVCLTVVTIFVINKHEFVIKEDQTLCCCLILLINEYIPISIQPVAEHDENDDYTTEAELTQKQVNELFKESDDDEEFNRF